MPGELDLDLALRLLSLPRTSAPIPRAASRSPPSIGRYGPYLAHDGKYAKLGSTAEVFETGMNAAVAKLAEAAAGGGRARGSREPLKVLGPHPRTEAEIKLMEGRFGPYVTDGTTNATLPKSLAPDALTLEEAAQLIDERAAKGPPAKKGQGPQARREEGAGEEGAGQEEGLMRAQLDPRRARRHGGAAGAGLWAFVGPLRGPVLAVPAALDPSPASPAPGSCWRPCSTSPSTARAASGCGRCAASTWCSAAGCSSSRLLQCATRSASSRPERLRAEPGCATNARRGSR